jgi:hypothetical protein
MTILPRPSVSPLPAYASMPTHRAPSFVDALKAIVAWLRGDKPTQSEEQLKARLVALMAEEMGENEPPEASLIDKPPIAPKRPRRRDVGL